MRLLKYVRPYLGLQLGIGVLMVLGICLSLLDPLMMKILIDRVIIDKNIKLLQVLTIALVVLFILRSVLRIAISYFLEYVGQRITLRIRVDLFRHLEGLDLAFFKSTKTGEIIARLQSDVGRVRSLLAGTALDLAADALSIVFILTVLLLLNWRLALLTTSVFPLLVASQLYVGKRIRRKSREYADLNGELVAFFQEALSAIKLVQSFVRERFEAMQLLRKCRSQVTVGTHLGFLEGSAACIATFVAAMGPTIVLYFGGRQVMHGSMSLGDLVAFYGYVGKLFVPVSRMALYNAEIQSARGAIDRVMEYFELEPKITAGGSSSSERRRPKGDIEFRTVSFSYEPGEPILTDVSFRIVAGQKVALVGRSGVGKSTVVGLLERFYDPTEGTVLLDGRDVRGIAPRYLRRHIGVISQDTILFNASIRENILYGRGTARNDEVVRAAQGAHIHEFIAGLPDGYETFVGERGMRLSGGQAQRISIARTILKDPAVLILDEAMSSLDTESERLVQEALGPLMRRRTTLVIAHRLTSITDADVIFVLHEGRLRELGTHKELVNRGGVYSTLWEQMIGRQGMRTSELSELSP